MPENTIIIHTDGGSRGNPGPAAIGIVISLSKQEFNIAEYVGKTTNNVAEYLAVVRSIEFLLANNLFSETVDFFLDSELVVKQLQGSYRIKHPSLRLLHDRIKKLTTHLLSNGVTSISYTHIPREDNHSADALVNQALDQTL